MSWSLNTGTVTMDGGDQATAAVTLLLVPLCLSDPRAWHWSAGVGGGNAVSQAVARSLGHWSLMLVRLQVALIYIEACFGKLWVAQWRNGTALYWVFNLPEYGLPPWWRQVLLPMITGHQWILISMTWATLVLEFLLAVAVVITPRLRERVLPAGIGFHVVIALLMGIPSFSMAMSGALILYLRRPEHPFTTPLSAIAARRHRRGGQSAERPAVLGVRTE